MLFSFHVWQKPFLQILPPETHRGLVAPLLVNKISNLLANLQFAGVIPYAG